MAAATIASSAMFPFWSVVNMLSNVATATAGAWPFWTLATRVHGPHGGAHVDAHRSRHHRSTPPRGCVLLAARLAVERPVRRGSRAHADRLHECAEAETNA